MPRHWLLWARSGHSLNDHDRRLYRNTQSLFDKRIEIWNDQVRAHSSKGSVHMVRTVLTAFVASIGSILMTAASHAESPTTEQLKLLEKCRSETDSGYDCELAGNAYCTSSTGWGITVHQVDFSIAREAYELGCAQGSMTACTSSKTCFSLTPSGLVRSA